MINLEISKVYSGFELKKITFVKEVNASLYEFEHVKSGAKLLYMDRDDDNKVFSAAFKTTPEDSTGVFHILEHSVLCGSAKYPVKEPFVDLLKGSMQTFLNAFTFPDKTMYPCASCNDRDFANLMSVYLDAVFAPAIYTHKEIFMQEGWHHEMLSNDSEVEYKGVVFNEMKGSFSSVDTVLYDATGASLFPDTLYRHSAGGFPPEIPNLTYEQFLDAHRKYYHPENSFLYLYGNMDVLERLEFIDREYLSKYERTGAKIEIDFQKPVINMNYKETFAISENEDEANNYYAALCYVVGNYSEREKLLALRIVLDALASNNTSPLTKLFIDKGMAEDMWAFTYDGIAQPYVIFQLRKTNAEAAELFEKTLTDALKDICEKGIDKKALRASLNQLEFSMREGKQGGTPAGLSYDLDLMDGWLYGAEPDLYLRYEDALESIKKGLNGESKYFEQLIESLILESNHKSRVVLVPSKTKQQESEQKEKDILAKYKESLSNEEICELVNSTKELIEYQSRPNSPEECATIPTLELSDIGEGRRELPNEVCENEGIKYLYHDIDTNKIGYQRWYFDASSLNYEELSYAGLLSSLLSDFATKKHSDEEIVNEIKTKLGGFGFFVNCYTNVKDAKLCTPYFGLYCSALEENLADSVELANEIITSTVFDKAKLKTTLSQMSSGMRNAISRSGDRYALERVCSYMTVEGAYNELLGGITYFDFINSLLDKIDSDFDEINEKLTGLCRKIFNKNTMTVGYSGSREGFEKLKGLIANGTNFKAFEVSEKQNILPSYSGNEAIVIPSGVNYNVKGCNFLENGFEYSGKMMVLSKIMRNDYLWNNIRVKGGAYGTGFSISPSGSVCFTSYRDPNVAKTLENYDNALEYLESFTKHTPSVLKYVISTVAGIDRPITPRDMGGYIESSYFIGSNAEYKAKIRQEVINTTAEDIEKLSALVAAIIKDDLVCTVGSESKIEEAKEVYKAVKKL